MTAFVCGDRGPLPIDLNRSDIQKRWCCYPAAMDGARFCTCWVPIFDEPQRSPRTQVEAKTRAKSCHDCAYRRGSPERESGKDLEDLDNFWCHQGIRRPVAYRHTDGRVRPVTDYATSPDYQPPMVDGVPYRANGRPADRCAGWAAIQAARKAAAA
jgi:hypothetical protein